MKTMIVSDFATMRSALLQLVGICLIIAVFMGVIADTVVGAVAAITAMLPFMFLFSLAATDEQNGWERFRLTMPITRRQVVFGRYASLALLMAVTALFGLLLAAALIGVATALPAGTAPAGLTAEANPPTLIIGAVVGIVVVIGVGASVALPLITRFGMTRGARIVPLVVVLVMSAAIGFIGDGAAIDSALTGLAQWLDTGNNYLFLAAAMLLAVSAIYIASAFISAKLYEGREF
ncbi:ABC-2 transporter permease [uncultured Adlercreutzia sp.]|uniref:ABC-2 transporter permease n=1 Tax=uncultured Adlercreutzia sp. TaxID=875803 RepID=UPI0026760395|nr:ABC-2 transporter permease [uncultured Adlercreutzia sp.]